MPKGQLNTLEEFMSTSSLIRHSQKLQNSGPQVQDLYAEAVML